LAQSENSLSPTEDAGDKPISGGFVATSKLHCPHIPVLSILVLFAIILLACAAPEGNPETVVPTSARATVVLPSPTSVISPTLPRAVVPIPTPPLTIPPPSDGHIVTRTIYPEQLEGYIPNPYMGWQDTQRTDKRFVETVGYRRMDWDVLNPADGVYDWSSIEALRTDMAYLGGAISFRVRTARPPPWGKGQTMPAWLVKQGAMIVDGRSEEEGVKSTEPNYAGCLFLEAHGRFVDAMRQRYDGDPDVVFIDIGSYGTYGEWDSEQYDDKPGSLDWHARRRIIDMYLGGRGDRPCLEANGQITQVAYEYVGFQRTQLLMPYTPRFADSLVYALSQRQNIGLRHDALGSEMHQRIFREEIGGLVERIWLLAPVVFEFASHAYTPEALHSARDFAREMHATFVHDNLGGRGDDQLVEELLAVIGYRFVLRQMAYTSERRPGELLSFEMTWENTGSAPPYYETYPLDISLTDASGESVLDQQLAPDIRSWLPGKLVRLQGSLQLPADFRPGAYDLRVAFIDPANGRPALTLAIAGQDERGRYLIGPVNVLP
jgi:hypothetical protein